jgi:Uma2 family endonuclease
MAAQAQTTLPVHRIDVETYNQIVASGALDGQRVELLEGLIVEMSPQSPEHALVTERLTHHLASQPRWRVRVQLPFEVPVRCEPEPDLAVLAEEPEPGHHPSSALLVAEVAVSSHLIDRNVKARQYARAAVPTYWLVDVPGRTVEVRTQPGPDGYERCDVYRETSLVPSPLEGVEDLDVSALLAGIET